MKEKSIPADQKKSRIPPKRKEKQDPFVEMADSAVVAEKEIRRHVKFGRMEPVAYRHLGP